MARRAGRVIASMVILYLLLGKTALGGLFVSFGAFMLVGAAVQRGEAMRRRLGLE